MEFFDKLGQKASEAYKVTADKTGKIAKEAKLKIKMGELKSEISDIYEDIGKVVYEKHIREDEYDISKEVEEKCIKIDMLSDEIETYLKQCLELKDRKQCANCYAEIEKDVNFCPECGEKQEKESTKGVEIVSEEKSNLEKTVEVESDVKTGEKSNLTTNGEPYIEIEVEPDATSEVEPDVKLEVEPDKKNEDE